MFAVMQPSPKNMACMTLVVSIFCLKLLSAQCRKQRHNQDCTSGVTRLRAWQYLTILPSVCVL